MRVRRRAGEQLVPEDRPATCERVDATEPEQDAGDGRNGPRATDRGRQQRGGELVERQMVRGQRGPVLVRGMPPAAQDRRRRQPSAAQGLGDSLALKWIDEARRVTDEKGLPTGGCRADHPHLEPAAEGTPR